MDSSRLDGGYLEIECRMAPAEAPRAIREVETLLSERLGCVMSSGARVTASEREVGLTGSVQIPCSGTSADQWKTVKETLRKRGLLEGAKVYQHHPAVKCRTQIWP